jgi:glycosyltransferase involved in cell wall biosynthesis
MKILWISHFVPYPPKGGSLQRSFNLFKECSKHHETALVALNQSALLDTDKKIQDAINSLSAFSARVHVVKNVNERMKYWRHFLALRSIITRTSYASLWVKNTEFRQLIKSVMKEFKPDAVHFDTIALAQYFSAIANTPAGMNHHNIESHMMRRRAEKEERWYTSKFYHLEASKTLKEETRYCGQFARNFTCSELDSARLQEIASDIQTTVIPNGVDLDYFGMNRSPSSEFKLLFVGGMSWYPNLDAMTHFLNDIWPVIKRDIPNASMTIVGRSPPTWMMDRSKKDPQLRITGFVEDVRPYFAEASAFVCPIRDGGGTKLKVLDCLATGRPLIAHPIACEGINVSNGLDVLFAEQPADYVQHIIRLSQDPEMAKTLGIRGRKLIEDYYSFKSIGETFAKSYTEIVASAV